jgi:hypothetical protein
LYVTRPARKGIPKQDKLNQMKGPPGVPGGSFIGNAKSNSAQVLGRRLAILWIGNNVEGNLLPLIETVHPRTLDLPHVHEDILAAIIWLNESVALVWIEPLHRALSHSPALDQRSHSEVN